MDTLGDKDKLQRYRRRLEQLKNDRAGKGTAGRVIHCKSCHYPKKTLKTQGWVRGRSVHQCPELCTSYDTCPAVTERKKEQFHPEEYLSQKIAELEKQRQVHSLSGDSSDDDASLTAAAASKGYDIKANDNVPADLFQRLTDVARNPSTKKLKQMLKKGNTKKKALPARAPVVDIDSSDDSGDDSDDESVETEVQPVPRAQATRTAQRLLKHCGLCTDDINEPFIAPSTCVSVGHNFHEPCLINYMENQRSMPVPCPTCQCPFTITRPASANSQPIVKQTPNATRTSVNPCVVHNLDTDNSDDDVVPVVESKFKTPVSSNKIPKKRPSCNVGLNNTPTQRQRSNSISSVSSASSSLTPLSNLSVSSSSSSLCQSPAHTSTSMLASPSNTSSNAVSMSSINVDDDHTELTQTLASINNVVSSAIRSTISSDRESKSNRVSVSELQDISFSWNHSHEPWNAFINAADPIVFFWVYGYHERSTYDPTSHAYRRLHDDIYNALSSWGRIRCVLFSSSMKWGRVIFDSWKSMHHYGQVLKPFHSGGGVKVSIYDQDDYFFIDENRARDQWSNAPTSNEY